MMCPSASESLLIPPEMATTGRSSAYAQATAFKALSPPTLYVTTSAPIPLARAYPSAA